jgi:predicted negative regulator of RcsB-dependent stress response
VTEVAVLDAARQVRVSAQHAGGNVDVVAALRLLGVQYPITYWGAAWSQVSERVAASFSAIREELQAAGDELDNPVGGT